MQSEDNLLDQKAEKKAGLEHGQSTKKLLNVASDQIDTKTRFMIEDELRVQEKAVLSKLNVQILHQQQEQGSGTTISCRQSRKNSQRDELQLKQLTDHANLFVNDRHDERFKQGYAHGTLVMLEKISRANSRASSFRESKRGKETEEQS